MASLETVVKRNGQEVHFEKDKIINAILKAGQATNEFGIRRATLLTEIVCTKLLIVLHENKIEKLNIEFIQDMVEEVLFNTEYKKTAKAFAVYREQRHRTREITNAFHIDLVNKYVNKEDWKVKENANTTYSLQGLHHYMSSEISKQYWLNQIYPKEIREAHTEGDLYIHDLGHLSAYCCGWSLEDILLYGFTGVPGKVSSKPPKHFRTALGQLVNFLFSLSGEISGAVAVSNFDTLLAPFVKYDNLTYEEVKQAMQEFIFNSNIATRTGFQCVPDTYECLTPSGWKKYHELNIGDQIYVCDINTNKILLDNLQKVNVYDYEGQMFNFYNPLLSFITTPNHNTITSTSKETIDLIKKTSEELYQLKSGAIIPITNDEPNINALFGMNITNITDWKGKVWCPTTATGTFICRNEYEVPFITGNSPFSNITLDLKIPSTHKDMPVIHDGKYHKTDTYKDFQNESIMINKAFCEVMIEGDASGRIFTFPIPTYSVDKDFDWDNPDYDPIFAVSGKYGLQYWSNYINSDMSPEDARSMCPLHKDTDMIVRIKIDEDTIATVSDTIGNLYDNYKDNEIYVHYKASYKKASFLKVRAEKYITITFEDNFTETLEYRHIQPIIDIENLYNDNPKELFNKKDILAKDLTVGMKIPFSFGMKTIIAIKESVPTEEEYAYCFEVEEGEPYFELASGMITHNCRLRLDNRELRRRGGGLFGASPSTGSLAVVTINLPRLGYLAKDEEDFISRLDKQLDLAKNSMLIKRKTIDHFSDLNMYPYASFYLKAIKERHGSYWFNHFNTIGIVGMNEACLNLLGCTIGDIEGKEFALRIMDHIRARLVEYQEETGLLLNLEQSPGESMTFNLALLDKTKYPDIKTSFSNNELPMYTNSTHLPVNFTDDIFELLDLQDELQSKYTGGSVIHFYLQEEITDVKVIKNLIRKICENYKLPYFSLTPTFSTCNHHGYIPGQQEACPTCGAETEIFSRIVGYYRPIKAWNAGKSLEFKERKLFKVA